VLRVPPLFVELYLAYGRRVNAELLGEVFSGHSGSKRRTDGCDRVVRKFRFAVRFSDDMAPSIKRILRILCGSSGDKVRRINAFGVVA